MRRESFSDRAVVLRTYDFGEADRIIVLLTRNHGVVRAVAKGVRRTRSRFGSRLQLFVDVDVQLYAGRNLATITRADTVAFLASGIIDDYDKYAAGCAMLESAERLASYGPAGESILFDTVVHALRGLQRGVHPIEELDRFLLRVMDYAGWAPTLFDCAQCGRGGPHHAFHPAVGGAVCHACRPSGSAEVEEEALHIMWLMTGGHAVPQDTPESVRMSTHRLVRAHLQWHLEQKVTSLATLESS